MNKQAVDNPFIKETYNTYILPLDFGQKLTDIGRITVGKVFRMFLFTFRLLFVLLTYNPNMVYFTIMPTGRIFYRDAVFAMLIKIFNCKLILHLHGKGIREAAAKGRMKQWIYKKVFKGTTAICLSKLLTADIETVHNGPVYILPNGIAPAHYNHVTRGNSHPVILYLSNLVKSKGIKIFLNSLVILRDKGVAFNARIVGDSADVTMDQAKEFAARHELSNQIDITGPKFGEAKYQTLAQSDIFVLPSLNECFPLAILEAMQAQLPVIATAIGGIPDMIQADEGLLIAPDDVEALASALTRLLKDEELRKRLGRNARLKFESTYTVEKFNMGLAEIFDNVNRQ